MRSLRIMNPVVLGVVACALAAACSDESTEGGGSGNPDVVEPVTGPPSRSGTSGAPGGGGNPASSSSGGVACKAGNVPGVACPGGTGRIALCHDAAYTDCSWATSAGATYACIDCNDCAHAYEQALDWCKTQN